jgi:hypothetical protein
MSHRICLNLAFMTSHTWSFTESLCAGATKSPLSQRAMESAQRRANNATFRGSPTSSPAVSPGTMVECERYLESCPQHDLHLTVCLDADVSRESVPLQPLKFPRPVPTMCTPSSATSAIPCTPDYGSQRAASRIPMPMTSESGQTPHSTVPSLPGRHWDAARGLVPSHAISGGDSLAASTASRACSLHHASSGSPSQDLDNVLGHEDVTSGPCMPPPYDVSTLNDFSAIPQSPIVSASHGDSLSPGESGPESNHSCGFKENVHHTQRGKTSTEVDADSVASLGSFLELEDAGQGTPKRIASVHVACTRVASSTLASSGFTFSATPLKTHGVCARSSVIAA